STLQLFASLAIKFLKAQGLFHRDISVGNIGYEYLPPCHGAIVKLPDLDPSYHHRTGTLPLMSIVLLREITQEHKVGFEVETLSWTLMWIVRVYANGQDTSDVSNHPMRSWFTTKYEPNYKAAVKEDYLSARTTFTNEWY
ncbi:hypothetical protein FRB90_005594, partial [Tulasnella sp. 427]